MPGVHKRVIHELLRPRQWRPNHEDRRFMLSADEIVELCESAERLFQNEKSVLVRDACCWLDCISVVAAGVPAPLHVRISFFAPPPPKNSQPNMNQPTLN